MHIEAEALLFSIHKSNLDEVDVLLSLYHFS
jgi:hypothetical protein